MKKFGQKLLIGAMTANMLNLIPAEVTDEATARVSQERIAVATHFAGCTILEATTDAHVSEDVQLRGQSASRRNTVSLRLQLTQTDAGMTVEKKYRHSDTVQWRPDIVTADYVKERPGQPPRKVPVVGTPINLGFINQINSREVTVEMYPLNNYREGDVINVGVTSAAESALAKDHKILTTISNLSCGSIVRTDAPMDSPASWAPSAEGFPQLPPVTEVS